MPELVERIDGFQAQGFAFNVVLGNHDSLDGNKPRIITQWLKHGGKRCKKSVASESAINRMLQLGDGLVVFSGKRQVFRILVQEPRIIDALA